MIKKIDWYIIKNFLGSFLFIETLLTLIILVIDVSEKLENFLVKKPPLEAIIFDYYIYIIPFFGNLIAPICVFLAVIFFTSKMAQNTEIVALLTGGMSFYRLMRPFVFVGIFLSLAFFYITGFVVPHGMAKQTEFDYLYFKIRNPMEDQNLHFRAGEGQLAYMKRFNQLKNEGELFTFEYFYKSKMLQKWSAEKAIWNDTTKSWNLKKTWIKTIEKQSEKMIYVEDTSLKILLTPDDIFKREFFEKSMNIFDLEDYIQLEKLKGSKHIKSYQIEYEQRFATPLSALILTLIGFAMSSRKRRGGIALQIGLGLALSLVYIALLLLGSSIVGDAIPIWLGVWMANILFSILAIVLLYIAPK